MGRFDLEIFVGVVGVLIAVLIVGIAFIFLNKSNPNEVSGLIESYRLGVTSGYTEGKTQTLLFLNQEVQKNGFVELKIGEEKLRLIPTN